jgi:glyoxylase-like metal-dependent hydrolase (beta-lactamase superfamily II)
MNSETYPFKVGEFRCTVVRDGMMSYGPPMFPPPIVFLCANASKEQLETTPNASVSEILGSKEWISSYNCLFVDTGKYRVLVDTGADGLAPTTGKLVPNLQTLGISPGDIDIVVLTHGHPDHLGGNTDGSGKPLFPRARWVISKTEWDFWTSNQAEQKLAEHTRDMLIGIARKNPLPIQNRVDLLDGESEIVPGFRAIAAPGHTPGQIAIEISSGGEKLLYISDVVLHPVHLNEPEWCAATDVIPSELVATRSKILPRAVDEKALVMAFHFPFPGLGHIESKGNTWDWKPV